MYFRFQRFVQINPWSKERYVFFDKEVSTCMHISYFVQVGLNLEAIKKLTTPYDNVYLSKQVLS